MITNIRKACPADVPEIVDLVNGYADEQVMLPRTPEDVALTLDDYIVAVDARGHVLGCGALREYSPSVAEVVSIAVAREAQGQGLGRAVVSRVEELARVRGYADVFLVTVTPAFFESLGYARVARASYPEKRCRHELSMAECDDCEKVCMWRPVTTRALEQAA